MDKISDTWKRIFAFLFNLLVGAGALACVLGWLEVKPKDVHMMPWAHWLWLIGAVALFAISLISSLRTLYIVTRKDKAKLVIHRAIYGAGPNQNIDITESLRNAARDALVISVDNSLVPHDPAVGVRKHLDVQYSYDDGVVYYVSRMESTPGDIVRLVLPEDSEAKKVDKLTSDIRHLREQNEKLTPMAFRPPEQQAKLCIDRCESLNCMLSSDTYNLDLSGGPHKVALLSFINRYDSSLENIRAEINFFDKNKNAYTKIDQGLWRGGMKDGTSMEMEKGIPYSLIIALSVPPDKPFCPGFIWNPSPEFREISLQSGVEAQDVNIRLHFGFWNRQGASFQDFPIKLTVDDSLRISC